VFILKIFRHWYVRFALGLFGLALFFVFLVQSGICLEDGCDRAMAGRSSPLVIAAFLFIAFVFLPFAPIWENVADAMKTKKGSPFLMVGSFLASLLFWPIIYSYRRLFERTGLQRYSKARRQTPADDEPTS